MMPFDLVAEVSLLARPGPGQFERKLQHPVDADARHHGLLDHDSRSVPSYMRPPMLEYSPSVFSRTIIMSMSPALQAGQRRADAGHQARRAQVDVLVELAAELEQRTPQRHVVGNLVRPADGAEVDRVVAADAAPSSRPASSGRAARSSPSRRSRSGRTAAAMPKRLAAASSTRKPSGMTSLPMPSPAITAMRCFLLMLCSSGLRPHDEINPCGCSFHCAALAGRTTSATPPTSAPCPAAWAA